MRLASAGTVPLIVTGAHDLELSVDVVRHTVRRPDNGLRYLHTFDCE